MLEAMACGTPVITTARGGPEGIVIDDVTGRHLPGVDDPAQLADVILAVLDDETKLENMRSQCAAFAREKYATAKIAARIRAGIEATQGSAASGGRM
jgi:glycosyltransferase involved in cell wall biosynthesis